MDELLREFLTETAENLDHVDAQLVRFEREPNNGQVLSNIFRLVHTIKGTCGGLPRLEALTHAAETLMGKFRDGMAVSGEAVSLVLAAKANPGEPQVSDSRSRERRASVRRLSARIARCDIAGLEYAENGRL